MKVQIKRMNSWNVVVLIYLGAALIFLNGCELVESTGTSEVSVGTPVSNPPDYEVTNEPSQTPPSGGDDETTQPPENPNTIEEGFFINNGVNKTASTALTLSFITLNRFQMKITYNMDCSGGTWETWSFTKNVVAPESNKIVTVSVQYKDWDGREGHCYRQAILIDNAGPQILFTRYPAASLEEGSTADLLAEISDSLSGVKSATCRLNGLEKPCYAGRNEVSITALPAGSYTFSVSAEDNLGNVSDASVSWNVVSSMRRLSQSIRVNDYKKVDILFVIDNSGSMNYEQKSMAQRTSNFLSVLRGLDYQIAITTTDPRDIALGDGRLVPLTGASGQYIISSTMNEATAQQRLSATLQRSETGSGQEQGIRSAYRAVERFNNNEALSRSFIREGAQLAVVLISDEDESANTTKNDPQSLVSLVHDSFSGQKTFTYHSIITKPGDHTCLVNGGYSFGDRYKTMSNLTGGVIGSVCASDYAQQVTGIAQGVRDMLKTLTLQCVPLSGQSIVIKRDGVAISQVPTVVGVNLQFAQELDPGNYTVEYSCLRE